MKDNKAPVETKRLKRKQKIRPVPIAEMRVPTALHTQRPFNRAQADHIAAHLRLEDLGYPIVNWRDGVYWLLDGQHRIAALKLCGFGEDVLDCEVYENLTDAEMADIFLGRDQRRAIGPFDKFYIACTAEHDREVNIRRSVEAQGVKISREKKDNCVSAVTALGKVYDAAGSHVLEQTTRTIRDGFAGDPAAFETTVIQGTGMWFHRYNGNGNEKILASKLKSIPHGVSYLIRRAEAQRERTGNQRSQCIAAVLTEIYNKGVAGHGRLTPWWKETRRREEEDS